MSNVTSGREGGRQEKRGTPIVNNIQKGDKVPLATKD